MFSIAILDDAEDHYTIVSNFTDFKICDILHPNEARRLLKHVLK